MRSKTAHKDTLQEFKARILRELNDSVASIILFGSVARNMQNRDSDIDILIVSSEMEKAEKKVLDIGYDIDYNNDFKTFIVQVYYTPQELEQEAKAGSHFIRDVLEQGVVLYDNGTFERIRKKALGTG